MLPIEMLLKAHCPRVLFDAFDYGMKAKCRNERSCLLPRIPRAVPPGASASRGRACKTGTPPEQKARALAAGVLGLLASGRGVWAITCFPPLLWTAR